MPTPLLYLPLKVPVRLDLVQPLSRWLDDDDCQTGFGGGGGDDDTAAPGGPGAVWAIPKPSFTSVQCRTELLRVAALRNCLSEHLQDSHRAALEGGMLKDCQDYHATCLEFEKRGFPTGEEDGSSNTSGSNGGGHNHGIDLTWKGAFGTKQQETHHTLLWDRACTLWNVAALRSAVAAFDGDATTANGLKLAISHLQQAASHLSLCRQLMDSQDGYVSTVDLSKPMLSLWEKICLAQAQVCVYKLANLGGSSGGTGTGGTAVVRNHTTLAYLIQGAAPLYNEALALAQDNRLKSEVPTPCGEWAAHCKAMSLLCQGRAHLHVSIDHRMSGSDNYGKEIARLRQAASTFRDVLKFCQATQVLKEAAGVVVGTRTTTRGGGKEVVSPMAAAAATIQPEVEGLLRLVEDRLNAAERDNSTIYMESVPQPSELPEIRAQTMVKTDLPLPDEMLQPRVSLFGWDSNGAW